MKAQIGVDAQSGLVHLVTGTAANVTDIVQTHQFLRGEEQEVTADAGFQGVEKRAKIVAGAQGVEWHIAAKSGKVKSLAEGMIKELPLKLERVKAQVGARVKYPFHVLKNIFRHQKTRYRWLAKNTAQLHRLFALTNLFLARRPLRNPAKAWTKAKFTVPAENLPSAGLQIAYFARKSQPSLQSF